VSIDSLPLALPNQANAPLVCWARESDQERWPGSAEAGFVGRIGWPRRADRERPARQRFAYQQRHDQSRAEVGSEPRKGIKDGRAHMRKARFLAVAALLGVIGALVLPATASADTRAQAIFFTRLTGAEEVPGPGDPDGRGFALVAVDTKHGKICYTLFVRRIEPATAAHIHVGDRGVAGPVVQGLEVPSDGFSAACVENPTLAEAIAANPSHYYVNVHNTPFPAGAVRGQLR
jgi:CHRD domain